MAKRLTKTQVRRLFIAIKTKTRKLWSDSEKYSQDHWMSTQDMIAIEKIINKHMRKL